MVGSYIIEQFNMFQHMKACALLAQAERYVVRQIEKNIRRGYLEARIDVEPLATVVLTATDCIALSEILKKKHFDLEIKMEPIKSWIKPGGFKAWLKRPTQFFRLTAPTYSVPAFHISWK